MNVLNKDYELLEEKIQLLVENWNRVIEADTLTNKEQLSTIQQYPVIPQLSLSINLEKYRTFIMELFSLLEVQQHSIGKDIEKVKQVLTYEVLEKWFQETISVNTYYFEQYGEEHQVPSWIVMFTAEHAARPFLKKISSEIKNELTSLKQHEGCCTACGEPARLAVISKKGKKELTCPRCQHSWEEKKISCAHCGTTEHGQLEVLKVEGDERSQIHACHKCKGYTKVIDTRKMIKKESPQLLDIKSIHLDYIAQEHGFGFFENNKSH